ncbi:MAG: hypothetical protein EOS58_24045 [Mesorhizobium sp.]|nr:MULTISPECIES: hypothetical protein [unclassified Mesorhizobium]RVC40479.1 hypothetical protein EN781_29480 [Mesorhizobium sp. M4A.F.Ca.ET.090.04.2.1]AZO47520.1 hypothetical protein EJ073_06440 [Mesorhizobium sp. M4B.F.Ca.ET.058.02.1.1]RWC56019.1 MAG: hypothetical protein EOS54_07515 [Mesorhizobium sp.]RWD01898.1 MAG: hypothetical protein EOS58_24045 [Mesorhizobium sp.]RWD13300.1 MAG: hypothetical protein EOS74_21210 [Mesorhizobium sp.]
MDSADSFLPFQDWRWLVTRRDDIEKTMIACHRKCWVAPDGGHEGLRSHDLIAIARFLGGGGTAIRTGECSISSPARAGARRGTLLHFDLGLRRNVDWLD